MVTEPEWNAVGEQVGFPCILKPADGYAWQDVFKVENAAALRSLYESLKETRTLLVQQLVSYVAYFRVFCVGSRETLLVRWNPLPFDMGEYSEPAASDLPGIQETIQEKTMALNAALGLDFNAVEWCVTADGTPVVIDSFNDVPDVRREKLPRLLRLGGRSILRVHPGKTAIRRPQCHGAPSGQSRSRLSSGLKPRSFRSAPGSPRPPACR